MVEELPPDFASHARLQALLRIAERKGVVLGIGAEAYIIGIIEGTRPPIKREEVDEEMRSPQPRLRSS